MPLGSSMGYVGRRSVLGASAALCTVNSHCVTSPMLRRGDWVIHFALQALQLHATPANPSPHTTPVRAKLYKPTDRVSSRLRAPLCCCVTRGDTAVVVRYVLDRGDRSFRCPSG